MITTTKHISASANRSHAISDTSVRLSDSPMVKRSSSGKGQVHTVHLSSIDQSLVRVYVRMGLCFPVPKEQNKQDIIDRFELFVKETISCLPYLSGRVVPVRDAPQSGMVEMQFTKADIQSYKPVIRDLEKSEYPSNYSELNAKGMPADGLISEELNPLPDKPSPKEQIDSAPVMGIQASFIEGGLIVTVYLHHSVGDGLAVAYIIRGMSTIRPRVNVDNDEALANFAKQVSEERLLLSNPRQQMTVNRSNFLIFTPLANTPETPWRRTLPGPKTVPGIADAKVLSFSLQKLHDLRDIIRERIKCDGADKYVLGLTEAKDQWMSTFNVLAALLWTGVLRARMARLDRCKVKDSVVMVPVNIRGMTRLAEVGKDEDYLGNGVTASRTCLGLETLLPDLHGEQTSSCVSDESLAMSLTPVAVTLRAWIQEVNKTHVDSVISLQNQAPTADTLTIPNLDLDGPDLLITTWKEMPVYTKSDLGLGLGNAQWARKTSTVKEAYGCLILEPREQGCGKDEKTDTVMEVMMQIRRDDLGHLLQDDKVMRFVERTA
ncbi:MAG: hypothetical protein Q9227_009110 [Pyrenula ochraceoflavens]